MHIWVYNQASQGAKNLAATLGVNRIKHVGSNYVARYDKTIINWGSTKLPDFLKASRILNKPENVSVVTNKLKFFKAMSEKVRMPQFWTAKDFEEVQQLLADGVTIIARKVLTGHSGAGIVVMEGPDDFTQCSLYTRYVPKKEEYRVHFVNGKIIDVQQKRKREGFEGANFKVRSYDNGFNYCRQGVVVPADVRAQAEATIAATGLDFGAIDVIWNEYQGKAYVLEVNTAPGLEGQTVESYAKAFKELAA